MKTWDEYKAHVKSIDEDSKKEMEAVEELASIVSAIIARRNEMGLSQRELAKLCGIPQSSVARIETYKTSPNVITLLKILNQLELKLVVSA